MIYLKCVTRENSSVSYVQNSLEDQLDGERTHLRLPKIHKVERMKHQVWRDVYRACSLWTLLSWQSGQKFPRLLFWLEGLLIHPHAHFLVFNFLLEEKPNTSDPQSTSIVGTPSHVYPPSSSAASFPAAHVFHRMGLCSSLFNSRLWASWECAWDLYCSLSFKQKHCSGSRLSLN